jgi:hypothetical protein
VHIPVAPTVVIGSPAFHRVTNGQGNGVFVHGQAKADPLASPAVNIASLRYWKRLPGQQGFNTDPNTTAPPNGQISNFQNVTAAPTINFVQRIGGGGTTGNNSTPAGTKVWVQATDSDGRRSSWVRGTV